MALNLDARQRALLQEMGLTLWLPSPAASAVPASRSPVTAAPLAARAQSSVPSPSPAPAQAPAEAAVVHAPVPVGTPVQPVLAHEAQTRDAQGAGNALFAPALPLFGAPAPGQRPAWLIVAECAQIEAPLAGDAGRLLHAMLHSLGLHQRADVMLAPLCAPGHPGASAAVPLCSAHELLQQWRPHLVLALGLPAARALLGGDAPLRTLRAQLQRMADGTPVAVSYAPAYLLRTPQAKAAAWVDWCHAHAWLQAQS